MPYTHRNSQYLIYLVALLFTTHSFANAPDTITKVEQGHKTDRSNAKVNRRNAIGHNTGRRDKHQVQQRIKHKPHTAKGRKRDLRFTDTWLKQCGRLCHHKLYEMPPKQIDQLLPHLQKTMNYHQRLRTLSAMFLGAIYKYGPLGEGPKGRYDRDPIFRLDRVDCVTFIETVMALALSHSLRETKIRLQKIRYKHGLIQYRYRNHFTATQWLVENHKAGYIKVITDQIGGKHTRYVHKKISDATWRGTRWAARIPKHLLPKTYSFAYVPLDAIAKISDRLPDVAWMGEVSDQPQNHPVSIQHVGFVIRKGQQLYFRDANVRPGVSDRSLLAYTRWRESQLLTPKRRVRIAGFAFAEFRLPPSHNK